LFSMIQGYHSQITTSLLSCNAHSYSGPFFNIEQNWAKLDFVDTLLINLVSSDRSLGRCSQELEYLKALFRRHRAPERLYVRVCRGREQRPGFSTWEEMDGDFEADVQLERLANCARENGIPIPLQGFKSLHIESEAWIKTSSPGVTRPLERLPMLLDPSTIRILSIKGWSAVTEFLCTFPSELPNLEDLRLDLTFNDRSTNEDGEGWDLSYPFSFFLIGTSLKKLTVYGPPIAIHLIEANQPSGGSTSLRSLGFHDPWATTMDADLWAHAIHEFIPFTISEAWRQDPTLLARLLQYNPNVENLVLDCEFLAVAPGFSCTRAMCGLMREEPLQNGLAGPRLTRIQTMREQRGLTGERLPSIGTMLGIRETEDKSASALELLCAHTQLRHLTFYIPLENTMTWISLRIEEGVRIFAYMRSRKIGRPFERLTIRAEKENGGWELEFWELGPAKVVAMHGSETGATCIGQVWDTDGLTLLQSWERNPAWWPVYDAEGLPIRQGR
jgi:hypothetical protein